MTPLDQTPVTESSPAEARLEAASKEIGALRNPDGCTLVCPDCTCRQLLERRRAEGEKPSSASA